MKQQITSTINQSRYHWVRFLVLVVGAMTSATSALSQNGTGLICGPVSLPEEICQPMDIEQARDCGEGYKCIEGPLVRCAPYTNIGSAGQLTFHNPFEAGEVIATGLTVNGFSEVTHQHSGGGILTYSCPNPGCGPATYPGYACPTEYRIPAEEYNAQFNAKFNQACAAVVSAGGDCYQSVKDACSSVMSRNGIKCLQQSVAGNGCHTHPDGRKFKACVFCSGECALIKPGQPHTTAVTTSVTNYSGQPMSLHRQNN